MNLKKSAAIAGIAVILPMLFCLHLWQPERQVLKHHEHLLQAASDRNWKRLTEMMDEKYTDRWGHDRAGAIAESREVLSQFFALTITGEPGECVISGNIATLPAHLKLAGNGTAVAEMAVNEVNALTGPFVFEWTRKSWKPWDWKLTRVDNRQLNIPEGY